MRKRRPEPKSAAVREAETALVRALESVVRGIERLQNEVRESAGFLEMLLRRRDVGLNNRVMIEAQLARIRKAWPELIKGRD